VQAPDKPVGERQAITLSRLVVATESQGLGGVRGQGYGRAEPRYPRGGGTL